MIPIHITCCAIMLPLENIILPLFCDYYSTINKLIIK
jgi:hypothetical protein